MSDPRAAIYERLAGDIAARKAPERPFILGITGIDCAGKTEFSNGLAEFLRQRGQPTQVIHLDDFNNPRSIRRSGDDRDELYYERVKQGYSFNFTRLIEELLRPITEEGRVMRRLTSISWEDDDVTYETDYEVRPDSVVILEGVFLFLDFIARYVDYYLYLEITPEERRQRASVRDSEAVQQNYERKFLPAFREFIAEYPPETHAGLIVDNTDWRRPYLK